MSKAVKVTI